MSETAPAGELVIRALREAGAGHLFTLNGGHIWPLLMGADQLGLPMIDFRGEQSAAFAAEGWAKLTRKIGVAAVTAGPGVTNTVSALGAAHQNDSPLLVLGGRGPLSRWGMGSLQEIDHVPVVKTLTKCAATIMVPDQAHSLTREAIRTALSARTGPAFLDMPIDVGLAVAPVPPTQGPVLVDAGGEPDPDQVAIAARLIRQAERPVLIAGTTVWWAGAEEELRRLVEAASVPTILNGQARGMLPPEHPLYRARARAGLLRDADLIVVVGAPLDFRLNFGMPPVFNEDAEVVYVDVDDFRKHRPAAAALFGDVKRSLTALAEAVRGVPARDRWLDVSAAAEADGRRRDAAYWESNTAPVHPGRLVAEIDAACDPDAVIVGDGGDLVSFAGRRIERKAPGLWMDPGPFGCLGSGAGYAIAAKLAHPDRQVVLIAGDGAFGWSAIEFDTMVRHRLPIVCVIGNNGIWATEKHPMQQMMAGQSLLADLRPGVRYDLVVEALGGHGELVTEPGQIRPAIDRAFRAGLPSVVNVLTDPGAEYPRSSVLL